MIILDNFDQKSANYKGAYVGTYLAILTGSQVISKFYSRDVVMSVDSQRVAPHDVCLASPDNLHKQYPELYSRQATISFEGKTQKTNKCIVRQYLNKTGWNTHQTIVFSRKAFQGGCYTIDVIEHNATGQEKTLGRATYNTKAKKLHPELRRPGDAWNDGPLFFVARAVLGERISFESLRQHFID